MGYNETKIIYASENTLKQRKGRLGRTTDGVYIQLYDDKQIVKNSHPDPEIDRLDLLDFEFNLWKSRFEGMREI